MRAKRLCLVSLSKGNFLHTLDRRPLCPKTVTDGCKTSSYLK
ncbi:hypothetical protein HMPREF1555_01769 [Porphyromonas gingivalis F0570]|uniref:Uncharacterized protein n=1 Tax=Porphyromonas gingivalis F0570 TaxID=1227271 RepID=A0A0E2LNG3_PORGN|nr:hypothetical protein HMPREF1555_01769 [Porphyromonas gingivalis F0570]